MSFPRYPQYKASGVEWLGEVPEGWGCSAALQKRTTHLMTEHFWMAMIQSTANTRNHGFR